LGILAFVLVTSAAAGVVLHATSTPNPANAPRGEACGHEFDKDHGTAPNWTHDEGREHDATSNHTNDAACDREGSPDDDHGSPDDHDNADEMNETENETFS
jgi:hypothetical protein